ncbi:MAG: prepilin-type N-terminal cleavage/methylation domain-containing protein [Patescibacteria group bacterium]
MRRAFTLIEIIIYLAIIGMIAVTLVLFSISVSTSRGKAEVVSEVQSNARFALDIMRQKIRRASGINIAASTFNSPQGVLSVVMPNASENTVFNLDNGRLRMTVGINPAEFLTSDEIEVTDLRFVNLTDGARENIRIFMTFRYKNAGSVEYQYEYSVESAMSIRF